jgi:predicted RND superfamily exporter protein
MNLFSITADWLVRWRWLVAAIAILVGAAAYFPAQDVSYDRSIERMFSADDPVIVGFKQLKDRFGTHGAILAVYQDDGLLTDPKAFARLEATVQRLRNVPGVKGTLSLVEIDQMLAALSPGAPRPVVLESLPNRPKRSKLTDRFLELFSGYTHSADGRLAAIACLLENDELDGNVVPRRQTVLGIREVMDSLPDGLPPGAIAGEPVMVVDGFELVEQDGQRLAFFSGLLLCLTMAVCFRDSKWLFVPAVMTIWTVLVTFALVALIGKSLTMVSSMLTSMSMVVIAATVSHMIVLQQRRVRQGASPASAMSEAMSELAWPVLGALTTDAVGFGSLWWSRVGPVADFGTMMVVGSTVVLFATILFMPLGAGRSVATLAASAIESEPPRDPLLITRWICRSRGTIVLLTLVLLALGLWGTLRLTVETDFTKNFLPSNPLVHSYQLIEKELGGAGVWDVMIPAPYPLDERTVKRVADLENRLRAIADQSNPRQPALTSVISLVDILDAAKEDWILARLPVPLRAAGIEKAMPDAVKMLYYVPKKGTADQQSWLRIMLRSSERRTAEQKEALIRNVEREVAAFTSAAPGQEALPQGSVTGFYVILSRLVSSLVRDQWTMFAVATVGMIAIMLFAFRSPWLTVIGLIPNILPVLITSGLMGWLGVRVNMGAAMIAAVSMGLSIDGSIHFLWGYLQRIAKGESPREALAETHRDVGWAMIVSTVALVVGFSTLCLSEFVPTIYFGALVSLTMVGGLFGNLIFLPAGLAWLYRIDERELS